MKGGIDKIFFTGSVNAGKDVMKKASDTLTPVCLELGGNDPMLVLEDADIERVIINSINHSFIQLLIFIQLIDKIYINYYYN